MLFLPRKWRKLGGFPFFSQLLKTENHYTIAWWKMHQATLQTQTLFWHKHKGHFIFVFPWWDWQLGMGRTPSMDTIWHNGALTAAGPRASNHKTNDNKTGREGNLCCAALPAYPTPVHSHILRHYCKSRWCSVVEQMSNYPPDTLQGLPFLRLQEVTSPQAKSCCLAFQHNWM